MRITGGRARGAPLKSPPKNVRPATDRTRQAVFSSLGGSIVGSSVLDLFAGSGSYGLEAISRGAIRCHFVEKNRRTLACLMENLNVLNKALKGQQAAQAVSRVTQKDVFKWRTERPEGFDFIFLDAPYSLAVERSDSLFALAAKFIGQNPAGRLLFEMPGDFHPEPAGWELARSLGSRKSGEPAMNIYKKTAT